MCVTDTGALGGKLVGIVSTRDYDFINDGMTRLDEIMTTYVVSVQVGSADVKADALEALKKHKFGKLPVVDANGNLVGLATRSMFKSSRHGPAT